MTTNIKNNFKNTTRGFSLVEMLVVVAIFFIITSVILFKQSKFSSDILITNAAYDVALVIREAQVYGVGSKQGDATDPDERVKSYGVYFDADDDVYFHMYSEKPIDPLLKNYESVYDSTDSRYSLVDSIKLPQEQKIQDFCGVTESGGVETLDCPGSGGAAGTIDYLNIAFVKPHLNPIIKIKYNDGSPTRTFTKAKIFLQSSLGDKCRTVVVNFVGQVSIDPVTAGTSGCMGD